MPKCCFKNNSNPKEMAETSNYLLSNKIGVDGAIVSDEIAKELAALSRFAGRVAKFFNNEEFFSVNLRKFDEFHSPVLTADDFKSLKELEISQDKDKRICG